MKQFAKYTSVALSCAAFVFFVTAKLMLGSPEVPEELKK